MGQTDVGRADLDRLDVFVPGDAGQDVSSHVLFSMSQWEGEGIGG
jgi:hypothetical protein